jgi:hypothetical protein
MSILTIKESFLHEMPDWIKVGEKVAIVRRNHSGVQQVQFFPVTKVTATQVVIGDYRYNLKNGLREMGTKDLYRSTAFLANPADPAVVFRRLRTAEVLARYAVKIRAENFASSGSPVDADRITEGLKDWADARKAADDYRAAHEEKK